MKRNQRTLSCLRGLICTAALLVLAGSGFVLGQELEPRAYASAPVGLKVLVAVYSLSEGSIVFDPALPLEDVTATIEGAAVGYFQGINFFGRYGNINVVVPYAWGPVQGLVDNELTRITRSGLGDPRFRLTFNLIGAPALRPREFANYRQKTNLGLGFSVVAPLGQYDPDRLINLGANRWAFKPELGLSHRHNRWLLELAGGAWFYSANDRFLGTSTRVQNPVLSVQGHILHSLPKRMWIGFDANFFAGGKTFVDGEETTAPTLRNSRFGVSFSFPIYRRHSFKISYDDGVFTRLGTDFSRITLTYRYIWLGLR